MTAASLTLSLTTPRVLAFELKPEVNPPMQHDLVEQPIEQVGGWVQSPEGPGLGIVVRDAVVDEYRF